MNQKNTKPKLSRFSSYVGNADAFRGQNLMNLLALELAKKVSYKDGYEKGVEDFEKFVTSTVRKQLEDYQNINSRIADYVRDAIKEHKSGNVEFKEVRADLSRFLTKEIKILVILDMEEKEEFWFTSLLNTLSMTVFDDERVFPELLFVNTHSREINMTAISSAYPSVRVYKDAEL